MLFKTTLTMISIITIGVGIAWGQQETSKKKELTLVIIEGPEVTPLTAEKAVASIQKVKEVKVDPNIAATKFREFMENIRTVFKSTPEDIGSLYVDEIELYIEMNAEGGFNMVVGQAAVGSRTGIKVVLKKRPTGR